MPIFAGKYQRCCRSGKTVQRISGYNESECREGDTEQCSAKVALAYFRKGLSLVGVSKRWA